jgi:alkylation response protein AidB-like acyl-CoA dehydrogenase
MDFDFSDDQEQLRDAVRKWVDKGYDFERRRKTVAAGGFDRAAYNELAELGWPASTFPRPMAAWAWARSKAWWSWRNWAAASCLSR